MPMSPGAPWWTIITSALQSDIQTFPRTSLTIPEGCAKINANNRLTNLEFAIVEFDFSKSLCPHKNSPIYLFPGYNTAPAVGCTVSFCISDCRKTGSVATLELPVRLREEPRGAGRSHPRKICGESRMVTITPPRLI